MTAPRFNGHGVWAIYKFEMARAVRTLMRKLGKKQLTLHLQEPMKAVPAELAEWRLALTPAGDELEYSFEASEERAGIPALLKRMGELGIAFKDLNTRQSSLEDIFVSLVSDRAEKRP